MDPKSFGGQNLCLPKICWTQNIGVHLELKENLELKCGPAQPNLFDCFIEIGQMYPIQVLPRQMSPAKHSPIIFVTR